MSIKDILAKAAKGEELSEDERAELGNFDPTDVASRRVKEVQEKAAKESAALKSQLEAIQAKLDEQESAGMGELEKAKRDLEKLNKQLTAEQKAREAAESKASETARGYAMEGIVGGIQWVDDASRNAGRILIQQALREVDDLGDEATVKPLIDAAKQSTLSRLIAAEGSSGTGINKSNQSAGGGAKQKAPFEYKPGMFRGLTPDQARERMQKAWTEAPAAAAAQ